MVRRPSRGMVRSPSIWWIHIASSTITCAMVLGSGPPFTTCTSTTPGAGRRIWSMVSSSTGGKEPRSTPRGPVLRSVKTRRTRRASGATPMTQVGSLRSDIGRLDLEDPRPPELCELALVRVEHVGPRVLVRELEDRALPLPQRHHVGPLEPLEVAPGAVELEEVAVEVERIDEIELGDVHQVDADELPLADRDRVVLVVEPDRVHRVHLVLAVEVGVEPVHHHHHLARRGPPLLGVDDEGPVESLVDVTLDRDGVAVIELQPERLGVELVGEAAARRDHLEGAIHPRGVDPVEVNGVGVTPLVPEVDADPVSLGAADRGARDLAVVGP